MSNRASPTVIGAFVVGSVALAVIAVAVFGSGRLFRQTYPYILYFDGDVNGLKVGAAVKFKGVEIGAVTDVLLNVSEVGAFERQEQPQEVHIPVLIELDEERIRERGATARLDDPEFMKRLIDAGVRGQLAMESFVTGLLYIKLDLFPDTEPHLIADPTVRYEEIPTVPTPLEEVQMQASKFLAKLEDVDFAALTKSLTNTVEGLDELVNSPKLKSALEGLDGAIESLDGAADSFRKLADDLDENVGPARKSLEATADEAGATLREGRAALKRARSALAPDSPLVYDLRASLGEVSAAARAVRSLAEYLERNPGVLLRGKAAPEGGQ